MQCLSVCYNTLPFNEKDVFVFLLSSAEKQLKILGVNIWDFSPVNLVKLGVIVVVVFGASFGPFIAMVS